LIVLPFQILEQVEHAFDNLNVLIPLISNRAWQFPSGKGEVMLFADGGFVDSEFCHGNGQLHFFFKVHAVLPWFKDGISMIAERMRAASKKKPPPAAGGGAKDFYE
jgi:hypothetical protein